MICKQLWLALLISSSLLDVAVAQWRNPLLLLTRNVQTASQSAGSPDPAKGQSDSKTDRANFINFCTGKTLTNGRQVQEGSCNGIVMGDIPAKANMVSTIIINPKSGEDLEPSTDFTIDIKVDNLVAGSFTKPDQTYYSAPQALQNGIIVGHTHVTVQSLGDLSTDSPPSASKFVFFKGVNDRGDGNGGLSASVIGGLPAGVYRLCTMTSASNHQPVIMPVAQRGAQDDCIRFTVGQGSGDVASNITKRSEIFGTRGPKRGPFVKRQFIA